MAGPEIEIGKKKSRLSLSALVQGFFLTLKTEGKAASTAEFLQGNLRRFLWYANQKEWPDDIQAIDAWRVREFLGYTTMACGRWGLTGNGSESCRQPPAFSLALASWWTDGLGVDQFIALLRS